MIKVMWWFGIFATFACFGALMLLIGLHEYHYSFDPYSWLHVGGESDLTRNLWNAQKDLYRYLIVRSFILTMICGMFTAIASLLKNKLNQNLK